MNLIIFITSVEIASFFIENIEPVQKMLEPFSIPTTDGK